MSGAGVRGQTDPVWRPGLIPRFAGELETEYARDRYARHAPLARFTLALAALLYLNFAALDALLLHHYQDPVFWVLLLALPVPACLLAVVAAGERLRERWYEYAAIVALLVNGLSLATALAVAEQRALGPPPQILVIQLWYVFFLLGVRFRVSLWVALTIALGYLSAMGIARLPLNYVVEHGFLYGAAVLLGAIAARMLESTDRRLWLRERRLRERSRHDALTALANRAAFYEHLALAIRSARRGRTPLALALIDLDHFKRYNDRLGHLAGDDCLRRVGALLRTHARRPMDIAARLGGEEFAVLWYGADRDGALGRASRLLHQVEDLGLPHPGSAFGHVTASIGLVCRVPQDESEDPARLVAAADAALYRAKEAGRNRVCEAGEAGGDAQAPAGASERP